MFDIPELQKFISLHSSEGFIAGIGETFSPGFFRGMDHFSVSGVLQSRLRDFQQDLPIACSLNSSIGLCGLSSNFSLGGNGCVAIKPNSQDAAGQVSYILTIPFRLLICVLSRRKRAERLLI